MLFPLLAFGQTWDELSTQAGQAYHAGRYELALELTQRSIRQAEQEFGTRHANYFKSRGDLATILKKKGQHAEAQRLEQDNLLDIERALGKENLTYVTALKNAGNTYLDQAAYQPAEQYYLLATSAIGKIIAKKDEYYEANYIQVFDAYVSVQSQLAVMYERMGRVAEAENLYVNLIGFSTSVLGSDVETYPMYAVLLNNLANVYLDNQ